jgi:hypothetical protein
VAGDLAWLYYLTGSLDQATDMNRQALEASPDELWIQFDLGLSLLAAGQTEAAEAEYQKGMDLAARQVLDAKEAGLEPPSHLWWGLDDAAAGLDDLLLTIETGEGEPAASAIADPEAAASMALDLLARLKSQAVALEFTGAPPAGTLTASVSPFEIAEPIVDDQGEVAEYVVSDVFEYGIDTISVLFDYSGMQDGQEVVFKMYVDGEEDPSWRFVSDWDLGAEGSAEIPLSLAYSNTAVFEPGEYTVEMYVDAHLAQRGTFWVEE